LILLALLTACAGPPATSPPPTINSLLLTVTSVPTVTPEATYTPFPTAIRMLTRTPFPTFEPVATLMPETSAPVSSSTPQGSGLPTQSPPTATTIIGLPDVSADLPELAAILTFVPNIFCHQWTIAQIGIINRGTAVARDFTVQWSFGWGEPQTVHVDELEWFAGPLWFFSGETAIQCDSTTTLTAWINIDTDNTVFESIEDNNYAEKTYTAIFPTPTP